MYTMEINEQIYVLQARFSLNAWWQSLKPNESEKFGKSNYKEERLRETRSSK